MSGMVSRRTAIVKRLLNLDISARKELQDILQLVADICEVPIVVINLLDDESQYTEYKIGIDGDQIIIPLKDAFCSYTILQEDLIEVKDSLLDERFTNNRAVTGSPYIRFYAGTPIKAQTGENIGSLCMVDYKPNALNQSQKQMLKILSRQIMSIFELEASLAILREEVKKVNDFELKLKSILQSSSASHMLVDKNMNLLAFNNAAAAFIKRLNGKDIKEGEKVISFLSKNTIPVFIHHFTAALAGDKITSEEIINYDEKGDIWWEVDFNPVYDHNDEIFGVAIDSTNITERIQFRQNISKQNVALKEIAQFQSHEIRRPVANIIGLVDVLKEGDSEQFQLHLQYIKKEAQSLDEKIHHIVQLSNYHHVAG